MEINLNALVTEQRNPRTEHIDEVPTEELCRLINQEDQTVPIAVEKELPQIAKAIDVIAAQIEVGGRLFYCGAGTSGRLGVLDASECPPTYGVDPGLVVGLIAGGTEALFSAKEGAEDSDTLCEQDLRAYHFNKKYWNSVRFESDVDDKLMKELIDHSYDEVIKKFTKKLRAEYDALP